VEWVMQLPGSGPRTYVLLDPLSDPRAVYG
jgi:hypothetical protein